MNELRRLLQEADASRVALPAISPAAVARAMTETRRRGRLDRAVRVGLTLIVLTGGIFGALRIAAFKDDGGAGHEWVVATKNERPARAVTRNVASEKSDEQRLVNGLGAEDGAAGRSPADIERELKDIRKEIAAREEYVSQLLAHEQIRRADRVEAALALAGVKPKGDPVERAAAAVVAQGDRLRNVGSGSEAAASYVSVVEHFPQTTSAAVARRRLEAIKKDG